MANIPPGSTCRVIKENTNHKPHHMVLGSLVKVHTSYEGISASCSLVLGAYKPESYTDYPHADRTRNSCSTWAVDHDCLEVLGEDACIPTSTTRT